MARKRSKPVVVLGSAVYGFEGLVHRVADRAELPAALRGALHTAPDPGTIRQYLLFLYFKALTHAHPNDHSDASTGAFCARLSQILGLDGGHG